MDICMKASNPFGQTSIDKEDNFSGTPQEFFKLYGNLNDNIKQVDISSDSLNEQMFKHALEVSEKPIQTILLQKCDIKNNIVGCMHKFLKNIEHLDNPYNLEFNLDVEALRFCLFLLTRIK
jgi:hypothetical protein